MFTRRKEKEFNILLFEFLGISSTENFSSDRCFIGRIRIEGSLCLKEIRGAEHGNSGIAWILKKGGGGI